GRGGSAQALPRGGGFRGMVWCHPLLATHLNPFDCASPAFGWRVGPGTLPPLPLPPLNRADERSDFGLYSHQSRPWLNTPAAWLTRQRPQPALGSCSSAPKICSLKPLPLEAQFRSDRARPGRSEQSVLSFIASCSFFLIGELLLGKLSETVVVVGNAPHDRPCSLVSHLIGNRASFLCTKAPMVRVPETNFLQGITSISGRHVSGDPRPLSTSRTVYRP